MWPVVFLVALCGAAVHRHHDARRNADCVQPTNPGAQCYVTGSSDRAVYQAPKNGTVTFFFLDGVVADSRLLINTPTQGNACGEASDSRLTALAVVVTAFRATPSLSCQAIGAIIACTASQPGNVAVQVDFRVPIEAVQAGPTTAHFVGHIQGQPCTATASVLLVHPSLCKRGGLSCGGGGSFTRWRDTSCGKNGPTADCDLHDIVTISAAETINVGRLRIVNGGKLEFLELPSQPFDAVINAASILVEKGGVLRAGTEETLFGTYGSTLTISLYGDINGAPVECSRPDCGVDAQLWKGGNWTKDKGEVFHNPGLPNGVTDFFYSYNVSQYQLANGTVVQNGMFGSKVLALSYGGTLDLHGAWGVVPARSRVPSANALPSSWRSVASPVTAGQQSTTLDGADWTASVAATWPVNRPLRVVLTSTDWFVNHNEELTATMNGSSIVFGTTSRPQFAHLGAVTTLAAGKHTQITRRRSADLRARLGLLTRAITIRSAGVNQSSPTLTNGFGGHVLVRQGFAACRIEGVALEQLGQAGYKGRYPVRRERAMLTPFSDTLWCRCISILRAKLLGLTFATRPFTTPTRASSRSTAPTALTLVATLRSSALVTVSTSRTAR